MNKNLIYLLLISVLAFYPFFLQADVTPVADSQPTEEQTEEQPAERPLSAVASGVREVGTAPVGLVESTIAETKSGPPIVGTLKGIERGAGELTRSAVKGVSNIVTLGHGQQTELEPPRVDSEHKDPATFKIKIPGS